MLIWSAHWRRHRSPFVQVVVIVVLRNSDPIIESIISNRIVAKILFQLVASDQNSDLVGKKIEVLFIT